jgi:hypothetical protein
MSEHASPSPEPAATPDKKKQDEPVALEDYAHPTTHQMRIVGRRRTDAEAKLEQQQREARAKPPE